MALIVTNRNELPRCSAVRSCVGEHVSNRAIDMGRAATRSNVSEWAWVADAGDDEPTTYVSDHRLVAREPNKGSQGGWDKHEAES